MTLNKLTMIVPLLLVPAVMVSAANISWEESLTNSKITNAAIYLPAAPEPCASTVSETKDLSSVRMEDGFNKFKATITASAIHESDGSLSYTITNKSSLSAPDMVKVKIKNENDPITTDAGVGNPTPREILARYGDAADKLLSTGKYGSAGQVTYTLKAKSSNAKLELALILFLVDEWFYYG